MSNIVYSSSIVSLKLSTRPTVWRLIWSLLEPWHRRFLDLCFSISKQISCYTRWMIQSIFDKFFRRHFISLSRNTGDSIVIQCQQGQDMSNIVYNSSIVSLKLSTRQTVWRLIWSLLEPSCYTRWMIQSIFDKFFRRHFISLSDICSTTRLIRWVLFSDKTLCIFLLCLKLIHKKVFYLNHPLEKFVPFLPEDMRESYTTYRLQQKLEKHFGDAIVIQCQQGQDMSNIVYNSSIVSLKLSTD
jgi:hypothetical protein